MAESDDIPMRKAHKAEREELTRIFNQFDDNGDNRISVHELKRAIKQLSKNKNIKCKTKRDDSDAMGIIKALDIDGDGYLSYKEFEKVMMYHICKSEYQEKLFRSTFNMFDLNGDGKISKEELIKILSKSGSADPAKEATELLLEADRNSDGEIDYNEFVRVFFNAE